MPLRKMCTTQLSVHSSCHGVVRVQWCWQLIHVQMSLLPGWQSEYIKLTFPSPRMTGCSESRQQSCHKQLSALTIIRFIYWQRSGRTTSWKASYEDRDILSCQTGWTTMVIRCALTLMGCCQSPPLWKAADWCRKNSLRRSFITFHHPVKLAWSTRYWTGPREK